VLTWGGTADPSQALNAILEPLLRLLDTGVEGDSAAHLVGNTLLQVGDCAAPPPWGGWGAHRLVMICLSPRKGTVAAQQGRYASAAT
jgi:hypothetical protein